MRTPVETEVKIRVTDARSARALLRQHGFDIRVSRLLEQNAVFDDANGSLRERGLLLRLRRAGKRVVCTFKGPGREGSAHKSREEREFDASDFVECRAVLGGIGFREAFFYEKYRTELERKGEPGHVTLDETPIGTFLELEGPGAWINRTSKELGFQRAEWITESYVSLYFAHIAANGGDESGMRF